MDFESIIIGMSILALIIVPIFILGNSGKKKRKMLVDAMQKYAADNQGHVTQHEICGNITLGIDDDNHIAYFSKSSKSGITSESVNLTEYSQSRAIKAVVTINKAENNEVIDQLEIAFKPNDKNLPEKKWHIYDSEENLQLYGEVQLVEKWVTAYNTAIKKLKK